MMGKHWWYCQGKDSQIAEVFYRINDSNEVSAVSTDGNGAFNLNLESKCYRK